MNWDERYSAPGFVYGTAPNDFLAAVAARIPPGRLLSLAEGEGRNAVFLAKRGFQVTAVDGSQVGLAKARQLAATQGVAIATEVVDLADFHIAPGAWDAILACFCHLPPSLRARLHREAVAGLRPGGHFILEAFAKEQLAFGTGGPSDPELLMSLPELQAELAGLSWLHAAALERDVLEGRGHTGRAAVVQLLGVKP